MRRLAQNPWVMRKVMKMMNIKNMLITAYHYLTIAIETEVLVLSLIDVRYQDVVFNIDFAR